MPSAFWKFYQQVSVIGLLAILITISIVLGLIATQKILPANTYINSISVGLRTPSTAAALIDAKLETIASSTLFLESATATESATSEELGVYWNTMAVVTQSQQPNKTGIARWFFALHSLFSKQELQTKQAFAEDKLNTWVSTYATNVDNPGRKAKLILGIPNRASSLDLDPGEAGFVVDQAQTKQAVEDNFNQGQLTTQAVLKQVVETLGESESADAYTRGAKFVGVELSLENEALRQPITISDQDLISVLQFPQGVNQEELSALISEIASNIDRAAVEPTLKIDSDTLKVTEFTPPQSGIELNQQELQTKIVATITAIDESFPQDETDIPETSQSIELPLQETQPQTSLGDTNSYGINEQIGFGDSYYEHSIPTRIKNVSLATSRVTDILVAPGKEFSFNKTLGDVSRATGFEPAYIIRNGLTELGDGGGVCQVSTTLFRAVLNAGLDVTLRLPHSYRVSYYELDRKPGIDATVYAGNVDFRFINDSPNYILIHGEADPKKLYMFYSIYGTSDGRHTEIVDHTTWGYAPPPPAQYIVDESLPPGAKKQIDWSAAGIKAKFTNVIYDAQNNVIREDTYTSNYKPWSAKYLVGPGTI